MKVTINKSSWLYKLNEFVFEEMLDKQSLPKSNFCAYFWGSVFSIVFTIALIITLFWMAFVIFTVLFYPILIYFDILTSSVSLALISSILYIAIGYNLIANKDSYINEESIWRKEVWKEETEDSQKYIFWIYIKCLKDKVCPMIEFVEK